MSYTHLPTGADPSAEYPLVPISGSSSRYGSGVALMDPDRNQAPSPYSDMTTPYTYPSPVDGSVPYAYPSPDTIAYAQAASYMQQPTAYAPHDVAAKTMSVHGQYLGSHPVSPPQTRGLQPDSPGQQHAMPPPPAYTDEWYETFHVGQYLICGGGIMGVFLFAWLFWIGNAPLILLGVLRQLSN